MNTLSPPKRILIVDDHPSVRDGLSLRITLHADLEVCGEADSEDEAFTLVKQSAPDLVLVDISLKNGNGIELLKRIRSHDPAIKNAGSLRLSGFALRGMGLSSRRYGLPKQTGIKRKID